MIFKRGQMVSLKSFFLIIYCSAILGVSIYFLRNPSYNWDILPYMGVILSYEKADLKTVHERVYTTAKQQIPPAFYSRLIDPSNAYRNSVAQNPDSFRLQLPFYVVKPLYTGISYIFYKGGTSLPMATVWPSIISYFLTALLLVYWMGKYQPVFFAVVGSVLVMISAPLLSVVGLSSPDMLSSLLLFAAIYSLTEKQSLTLTFVFLTGSIFARLDNIIPAIFFLATIAFAGKWKPGISTGKLLLLLCIVILCYFSISLNARSFGWSLLYYPSFAKQLNTSYVTNNSFVFGDYVSLAKSQLMTGLSFSFLSLFFLLVLLLIFNPPAFRVSGLSLDQALAISFVFIIITRFLLQPLINDRFYIPYYLAMIIFLVKKNSIPDNTAVTL